MTRETPPAKLPAYAPEQNPTRLRCEGWRTFGWAYDDGTVEIICRERNCRRTGHETRHLFNIRTGVAVTIYVPQTTERARPPLKQP
jgi:hypothetical protein